MKMGRIMPGHRVQFDTIVNVKSDVWTFLLPGEFIASEWGVAGGCGPPRGTDCRDHGEPPGR